MKASDRDASIDGSSTSTLITALDTISDIIGIVGNAISKVKKAQKCLYLVFNSAWYSYSLGLYAFFLWWSFYIYI